MQLKNSFWGYTDSMNGIKKTRTEKVLDKTLRYQGKIMKAKHFILTIIQEGYTELRIFDRKYTKRKVNLCYEELKNPVKEYTLFNGKDGYDIKKTEYDFASYIIAHGLHEPKKMQAFLLAEKEQIAKEEKEKQEHQVKELELTKERDEFLIKMEKAASLYENDPRIDKAYDIFCNKYDIHYKPFKLLYLVDNISNINAKKELKNHLHSHNKASKAIFTALTGTKLPPTNRGTFEIIDNWGKNHDKRTID